MYCVVLFNNDPREDALSTRIAACAREARRTRHERF